MRNPGDKRNRRVEALERIATRRNLLDDAGAIVPISLEGVPRIESKLKVLKGGVDQAIEALRTSEEPDAAKFLAFYDSLTEREKIDLKIEEVSVAADVPTRKLYGMISASLLEFEEDSRNLLIGLGMSKIVTKSMQMALRNDGVKDRENLLKAVGVIPLPKGVQVAVQRNNYVQNNVALPAPQPEQRYLDPGERLRSIQDAIGQHRLPSSVPPPATVGPVIEHMQQETAELIMEPDYLGAE